MHKCNWGFILLWLWHLLPLTDSQKTSAILVWIKMTVKFEFSVFHPNPLCVSFKPTLLLCALMSPNPNSCSVVKRNLWCLRDVSVSFEGWWFVPLTRFKQGLITCFSSLDHKFKKKKKPTLETQTTQSILFANSCLWTSCYEEVSQCNREAVTWKCCSWETVNISKVQRSGSKQQNWHGRAFCSQGHFCWVDISCAASSGPPHSYGLILICQPCSCLIAAPVERQT